MNQTENINATCEQKKANRIKKLEEEAEEYAKETLCLNEADPTFQEMVKAYIISGEKGFEYGYNLGFREAMARLEMIDDAEKLKNLDRIAELENEIDYLRKKCEKQEETLKNIRVALIKERVANVVNYGQGGIEMFERIFENLKEL